MWVQGEGMQLELIGMLERLSVGSGHVARPPEGGLRSSVPCEAWVRMRCPGCGATRTRRSMCARLCATCPRREGVRASAIVSVMPRVPVRHWIYTPGDRAQAVLRREPAMLRWLARRFAREIFAQVRAACPEVEVQGGAATVVHWTEQSMESRVHVHAVAIDGGYVRSREGPRFVEVGDALPESAALEVARRMRKALTARLGGHDAGARGGASRGTRASPVVARKVAEPRAPKVAGARSDDASVRITAPLPAEDRPGLVRLARYLTRPWIDPSRVELGANGRATMSMRRARRDGAKALQWDAEVLRDRILSAVPPGPTHPIAFHGVLAPRAALRSELVPGQISLWQEERRARRSRPERCERCGFALVTEHVEVAVDDVQAG